MSLERVVVAPVCDYAPGDLAWAEILRMLNLSVGDNVRINLPTAVPSFNTIATGFCIAQLAATEIPRGAQLIVFGNCAPRRDRGEGARSRNEGEHLLHATLHNGVELLVVNSGHSLSFVRDQVASLWSVQVDEGGTQFRSRDRYPGVISLLAADRAAEFRGRELETSVIPEAPEGVVAYIDSFGNVKTTYRASHPAVQALRPGQAIELRLNGHFAEAQVATGSFNIEQGHLAFAPGSSGGDDRFMEVFLRGGRAAAIFGIDDPHNAITAAKLAAGMQVDWNE